MSMLLKVARLVNSTNPRISPNRVDRARASVDARSDLSWIGLVDARSTSAPEGLAWLTLWTDCPDLSMEDRIA
jgi:hypothetical protein